MADLYEKNLFTNEWEKVSPLVDKEKSNNKSVDKEDDMQIYFEFWEELS